MMTLKMKRSMLSALLPVTGAFAIACSGGSQTEVDDVSAEGNPGLYPLQPLTQQEVLELRQQQLSALEGHSPAAGVALSDAERDSLRTLLAKRGVRAEGIWFEGGNVWLDDASLDARSLLQELDGAEGVISKGRALGQVVNSSLAPGVSGAPSIYVAQSGARFSFFRPEISSSEFEHLLVVPNDMPADMRQVFADAVENISQAGAGDCLNSNFLTIITAAQLSERLSNLVGVAPRTVTVKYEPDPCPHSPTKPAPLGCSQFPHQLFVEIFASGPDGLGGVGQTRMLTGGYVAIDSNQLVANTPGDAADALSTVTHELMHTLGVAHPQEDPFDPVFGTTAVKIDIPGTNGNESGFQSIMALRGSADRSQGLSADDTKVIRTLYQPLSGIGCGYTNGFSLILPAP